MFSSSNVYHFSHPFSLHFLAYFFLRDRFSGSIASFNGHRVSFFPPVLAIFTGASIIRRDNLCRHYDANEDSLPKPPSLFTTLRIFTIKGGQSRQLNVEHGSRGFISRPPFQEPLEYLPSSTLIPRPVKERN